MRMSYREEMRKKERSFKEGSDRSIPRVWFL